MSRFPTQTKSPTKLGLLFGAMFAIAVPAAAQDWRDVLVSFVSGTAEQKSIREHQRAWFENWDKSAETLVSLRAKSKKLLAGLKDVEGKPDKEAVKATAQMLHKSLTAGDGENGVELEKTATAKAVVALALRRIDQLRLQLALTAINRAVQGGARYAGQHSRLKKLGDDIADLLLHTVENPPQQVTDGARALLLAAIRDVTKTLTDKQISRVEELAKDEFEDENVQEQAMYLLWECGKQGLLKELIARVEADAKKDGRAATSLRKLAGIWWQIHEYKTAVATYRRLFKEAGDMADAQMGSDLYNMACSQTLSGDIDGALATMDKALTKGANSIRDSLLQTDHDINGLRKDERFWELLKKHKRNIKKPGNAKGEKTGSDKYEGKKSDQAAKGGADK